MKFLVRMTSTDILNIEDKEKEGSKSDAGKERKKKKVLPSLKVWEARMVTITQCDGEA